MTPPGFDYAAHSEFMISYFLEEIKRLYFVGRLEKVLEPSSLLSLDCVQNLSFVF